VVRKNSLTRAVEVEYWVIDESGRLADPTPLVDAGPGVEREFVEPLIEVKTTPCETSRALHTELLERLDAVVNRADELGLGLVPLATPLHWEEIAEIACDRTTIQNEVIGDSFEYVRHCAGTHVHVEQRDGHEIDQLNTLIALDPALALLNSAPYFRGKPLSAGVRSKLYRWRAYDGFRHQGRLWPYVEDVDEWEKRRRQCYERFRAAALEAGVESETFDACFDPESSVWTPVQLRERFPTVEWRSPDTTLPSQVLRLADELVEVVSRVEDVEVRVGEEPGRVTDAEIVLAPFDRVRSVVETAIEDGMTPEVRSYLERMGLDTAAFDPLTREFEHSARITPEEARQRRLEYADRLERDVRRLSPPAAD